VIDKSHGESNTAMLSRWKPTVRPLAEVFARVALRLGFSPNGITLLALGMSLVFCALLSITGSVALFLPLVVGTFMLDAVDGAAARLSGRTTRFGSYLDAMADRFSETAAYMALGVLSGAWPLVFVLAVSGLLFSYAKSRAAMEVPIQNDAWPDLMERPERMFMLGAMVLLWRLFPDFRLGNLDTLNLAGCVVAALTIVSVFERILRARRLILASDKAERRVADSTFNQV
jgi:phosphatidylglycerophosphate synthase